MFADTFVTSADISDDTLWSKNGSPYIVTQPVVIQSAATLTIEAGVVVIAQGIPFEVRGRVFVAGADDDPALFTRSEFDYGNSEPSLVLVSNGGTIDIQNSRIDGEMYIRAERSRVRLDSTMASSSNIVLSASTTADFINVVIDSNEYTGVGDNSVLNVTDCVILGGDIHVESESMFSAKKTYFLNMGEFRSLRQSIISLSSSTISGSDGFLIKDNSRLETTDSNIESIFSETSLLVFNNSEVLIRGTHIEPLFSNLAIVTNNSVFTMSSTSVSNILYKGITAINGSSVFLRGVDMDNILATDSKDSFFVSLIGSKLDSEYSHFKNSPKNILELYDASGVSSEVYLYDSSLMNYGSTGIYAVHASGTVMHSIIAEGKKGIENIASHVIVSQSRISHNSEYGASSYPAEASLIAQNVFWGDSSGPLHLELNSSGKGNMVSGAISFIPWLESDPTDVCCSSVMFIPGFMASRLYGNDSGEDFRIWEPTLLKGDMRTTLALDEKGTSIRNDINARGVLDEFYGLNIYKSFIGDLDNLKNEGYINSWSTFPYDWRLSVDEIAGSGALKLLSEFLRLLRTSYTGKVTIIAHSNGGLVTKVLMRQLARMGLEKSVDTLVFIAVPQVGTPQSIGALLHGFGQGIPKDSLPILASPKALRDIGKNMPGAYGLLPSGSYFNRVLEPIVYFDGYTIADKSSLYNFLGDTKGRKPAPYDDLTSAQILNPLLLSNAEKTHTDIDEWYPPCGMRVVQIAGWGEDTVRGIRYYQGVRKGKPIIVYDPLFTVDGDQTVVVPSALFLATSTVSVESYWLDLSRINKGKIIQRSHSDLLEIPVLRDFIAEIIKKEPVSQKEGISTSSPQRSGGQRLQFLLHSENLSINAYDDLGNHTGISTSTGLIEEAIPESSFGVFGTVVSLYVPQVSHRTSGSRSRVFISQNLDSLAGSTESFTLDMHQVIGGSVDSSISFIDVPVSTTTAIFINVPDLLEDVEPLHVDSDGDGRTDFTIKPGERIEWATSTGRSSRETVSIGGGKKRLSVHYASVSPLNTDSRRPVSSLVQLVNRKGSVFGTSTHVFQEDVIGSPVIISEHTLEKIVRFCTLFLRLSKVMMVLSVL